MEYQTCEELVADTKKNLGTALAKYAVCLGGNQEICRAIDEKCGSLAPDPEAQWDLVEYLYPDAVDDCRTMENFEEIKQFVSYSNALENAVLCRPIVRSRPRPGMNMGPVLFLVGVAGLLLLLWLFNQDPESPKGSGKSTETVAGTAGSEDRPVYGGGAARNLRGSTFKSY